MTLPRTPSLRLDGRRALVTGAGRGIGLGAGAALAEAGAAVTLVARTAGEVEAAAREMAAAGASADWAALDVTDLGAVAAFFAARPTFDILVNNAGTNRPLPMPEVTPDDYDAVLGLNLRSAFFVAQGAARAMLRDGVAGSLIHMGSQMGHVGGPKRSLYCASKWGLEGMSKAFALDLAHAGIRSNTVAPTFIATAMTRSSFDDPEFRAGLLSRIKLGRVGRVEDVMGAVLFLASDASAMVTGTSLIVDGGLDGGLMPLAFHASPPDGHWINDPNALAREGGGYRLYVQHREDAPDYRATGWGAFESGDLLGWRWRGVALPPDGKGWAYSGSVVRVGAGTELFHTIHDPDTGLQHQRRLTAKASGWRPLPASAELARPAMNRRDPFVFAWRGEWRMLLTQSCDWRGWREDPPSHLVVLASYDREQWEEVGRIGPRAPPGVMWEVPVLVPMGDRHALFVSLVDRRGDGTACSVRGWLGRFDGAGFAPDPDFPADGQLIDLGPDFYALMAGVEGDWDGERPFVAWASSWAIAREPIWPGFAGGPITLPRRIAATGSRFVVEPWPGLEARFRPVAKRPAAGRGAAEIAGDAPFALALASDVGELRVSGDPDTGDVEVSRVGSDAIRWLVAHEKALTPVARRRLDLFIDGPLVELFDGADGASVTAALPGALRTISLTVAGGEAAFDWSVYAPECCDPA